MHFIVGQMTRALTLATLLALSLDHGHCQNLAKTPAFEVASITPCKPGTPEPPMEHAGMVQFTAPGGRFKASATTLKFLLEWAYGIQPSQHSGGPSWIDTDRYDIIAKADGNATDDQMKLMIQTLLADRFQLMLHREKKELSVYVISVGKAAPRLYVFARQLGRVIVNETGLGGDYDFTLDLAPDESRPSPLDPALLMTAMREQLGLTLKSQKAPVDFLVIDSAEKVTAGN
jgi:hypothetical protein